MVADLFGGSGSTLIACERRGRAARLMELVSHTRGAQFTPAGVLRLPLDGAGEPASVLALLRERLAGLASEPRT